MTRIRTLHRWWSMDAAYKALYDALDGEFNLAAALIGARANAELTQKQVAARMQISQAFLAGMEGSRVNPSLNTLRRFAAATGTRLRISFEPVPKNG